jgi:hypothetical protein
MHLRDFLRAVLLTGVVVGGAQACPDHAREKAAARVTRTPSQAALVAWKPRAWAAPAKAVPAASVGMRVARDPVDGTLYMPGPDEVGLEQQATFGGERRPVAVTRRANGAVRAQLDESFHEYAVVRVGPDGKPFWTCVSGPAEAERLLKAAPPSPRMPATGTKWEDK